MNHQFVIFDTETTSLFMRTATRAGAEVIQFSAILIDECFNITRVINRYCSSTQLVDPNALKVHNLSDKKISILSDDKFFEQIVKEEKLRDLDNVTWIGYNVNFDIKMVNQTLLQNGYESLDFGKNVETLNFHRSGNYHFDAMRCLSRLSGYNRNVKLSDLVNKYYGVEYFKQLCSIMRNKFNIIDPLIGKEDFFHNAIFDSLATLLIIQKFKNFLLE